MAWRRARTTQRLYGQVPRTLPALPVAAAAGNTPPLFGLVARYVTGLVLLEARPSQTRISQLLPARAHDALNRRLRTVPLAPRALWAGTLVWVAGLSRALGTLGYLVVDDVVVDKPCAQRLPWAAWPYSFAQQRQGSGCPLVLRSWTSDATGGWRSPGAFRLWRPKRPCAPGRYPTKPELVVAMRRALVAAGGPAAYLVGDPAYTDGCVSKAAGRLGLVWVGTLSPRTTVVYRGNRQAVRDLAGRLKLKWRPQWGGRAIARRVYAPAGGQVRLVVLKNEQGNCASLVTHARATDRPPLVQRPRRRGRIETICRDTNQLAGRAACQCGVDHAWVRQVALVFRPFVGLPVLRRDPPETVGAGKARWQGEGRRDGQTPPPPLRVAPPAFRHPMTA